VEAISSQSPAEAEMKLMAEDSHLEMTIVRGRFSLEHESYQYYYQQNA